MDKKNFTREAKIGVATIVSLTLLFFGFNYLKGINLMKPSNYYYATMPDVSGLVVSSPVYVNGFNVGLVRDIRFDSNNPERIVLELGLNADLKMPAGATAHIYTELMGTAFVKLQYDSKDVRYLQPGDTIKAFRENSLTEKATEEILPQLQQTLPRIDSVLCALQAVLGNPAIANSLESLEKTTKQLEVASTSLNSLLKKDVPQLISTTNMTMGNLNEITANMKQIDLKHTVNQVDNMLLSLKTTVDKVNSDQGTLGLLLNDPTLYQNLNSTIGSANNLLIDLKQHPSRYINVSVFGRKKD